MLADEWEPLFLDELALSAKHSSCIKTRPQLVPLPTVSIIHMEK